MGMMMMQAAFAARGLTNGEFRVLITMADMANGDGICWPTVAFLADKTEMEVFTVDRHIKRLMEKGFLIDGVGPRCAYYLKGLLEGSKP